MMSASEGVGGSRKSGQSKGGARILYNKSVPNADMGGGGQKI